MSKKLAMHRWDLEAAMNPSEDVNGRTPMHFLDRETGEFFWLYEDDDHFASATGEPAERNAEMHRRIDSEPTRYLGILPLDHRDFQRMLRDFLATDWTTDEDRREDARDAYTGAIGRWKRRVRDREAIEAFRRYETEQTLKRGEEFLRENGILPLWK